MTETFRSPAAPDVHAAMWDMITAYRVSQVVRVAAAISLAEHCAEGTVTAESIAASESTDPDSTARLLRACAALGLVRCTDNAYYQGTPLLDTLRREAEGSQWGFAMSLPAPGHWGPWGELLAAVRTGHNQAEQTIGASDVFDYYGRGHREEAEAFFEGLNGMTAVAGAQAARAINTTGVPQAVDVGGATGTLLHDLMALNPDLHGIVFDLPAIVPQAEAAATKLGLDHRITAIGGDFTESVPPGADLYLLRYVLHDWTDQACVKILGNCRAAMAPGARLCVLEMLLGTVGNEDKVVPMQDINMLAILHGRERSAAQFDALLAAAGLRRTSITPTNSPMSVIEAVRA